MCIRRELGGDALASTLLVRNSIARHADRVILNRTHVILDETNHQVCANTRKKMLAISHAMVAETTSRQTILLILMKKASAECQVYGLQDLGGDEDQFETQESELMEMQEAGIEMTRDF